MQKYKSPFTFRFPFVYYNMLCLKKQKHKTNKKQKETYLVDRMRFLYKNIYKKCSI